MVWLTLRYDLRAPAELGASPAVLYPECLAQCRWADRHGFDLVALSEHHGTPDGFLPAPVTLAAAVAGATERVRISIAALLVPLHDPVRLAEELAVTDLLSGGRVMVVAGLGYRPEEFEMAGVDRRRRGAVLEEHLEVMRQAWTGEPFTWRGREIVVRPRPASDPHPLVLIGGSGEVSARRAARLRLGFQPALGDPALGEAYRQACREEGWAGGLLVLPSGPGFVHVTRDPERDWARLAPHLLHDARTYHSWQPDDQRSLVHVAADDLEGIRASGVYRVVTPDECVALAGELGPMGSLTLHPLMGGMPAEMGWESLELLASEVLPRLRPPS